MPEGTNGAAPVLNLKEKRENLSKDVRGMVRKIMAHCEEELIDSLPELINGVRVSKKQSSFSPTIALNKAKGRNLKVTVDARVRAARQPLEFEAHLTNDDQLALGWESEPDPVEPDDQGEPSGFDDTPDADGEGSSASSPMH